MPKRTLYHFTCDHGRSGITDSGLVVWPRRGLIGRPVAWFTDLASPSREALGLTSRILSCDRMTYRFRVAQGPKIVAWHEYCKTLPAENREFAELLSEADGAQPDHWFVSPTPVKVLSPTLVRGVRAHSHA